MTILKLMRTDGLQSAPAHALEPAHVHDDRPNIPTSRKVAPFMSYTYPRQQLSLPAWLLTNSS